MSLSQLPRSRKKPSAIARQVRRAQSNGAVDHNSPHYVYEHPCTLAQYRRRELAELLRLFGRMSEQPALMPAEWHR